MSIQKISFAEVSFQTNVPVSSQFDDIYFSPEDGLAESIYVFQQGNNLWERWQQYSEEHFVIAETGFGTGLNFFAVMALFRQFRQTFPDAKLRRLFFISFEKYPLTAQSLQQAYQAYPQFMPALQQLLINWRQPIAGCYRYYFDQDIILDLWFGELAENLPQLGDYYNGLIDAWFLDGFAPSKNPTMWTDTLFQQMFRLTKVNGTFATFTAASQVRKGLMAAGFEIQKRKGFARKRECLSGCKLVAAEQTLSLPWYLPQAAKNAKEVAIIGGGVASVCLAYCLWQRGSQVTIYCEDADFALNASGNKQGAFYPQLSDDDERHCRFYSYAFAYGQQFLTKLAEQVEFEHQWCDVLLCGYQPQAYQKLMKIAERRFPETLFKLQTAAELSERAGLPLYCDGAVIQNGAWLNPRQLVQNLAHFLQRQGVKIYLNTSIRYLDYQDNLWHLTSNSQQFAHHTVVIANGHKLSRFAQTAELPTYAVRGQVSQIPTTEKLSKLRAVLCYDGYLTPMDSQKQFHCIGASHIRNSEQREFNQQEQQQNQQKIQQNLAPADWLVDVDTSGNLARTGVRCSVRDRLPICGNVGDFSAQTVAYQNLFNLRRRRQAISPAAYYQDLYVLGALGSRGLTSAPLLAEMLASLIYAEPLPLGQDILAELMPNRFWLRKWLKGTPVPSRQKSEA
ncbi:bifunctional tRNA (5-methylaminomethyl-2-thiouridine)(34)-methyltransferase MnmD/FAD-dependent 5-carboxymethylaminomethyl-2-thiouridine(34) oxidoreductase MnmC [Gallibacterium salpingitidis]|uniref:tRNA 5-methylaminomethyl-2-thiouridine biosynthesis bifunctional protein MnmC n=1 Tax=Gallibacterium salpingitidis TaxID=505341 RepID=A0A1A7NZH5_9PAST|nr:bifunctional tRNA (5-methylaminomethyl-2-thiouridine)(34)-methyltransferase MnmD/FAD-dependent 5-carboxymethylaminomethyl-2-thiouridine(34) oxidoreductase MnmC [Gallibacterium salpingitidis]OBW94394.1 FAD-dependent cmnm(5)s(2)U34 oxidoreductase [Gallibacterium salpingitidis]